MFFFGDSADSISKGRERALGIFETVKKDLAALLSRILAAKEQQHKKLTAVRDELNFLESEHLIVNQHVKRIEEFRRRAFAEAVAETLQRATDEYRPSVTVDIYRHSWFNSRPWPQFQCCALRAGKTQPYGPRLIW